MSKQLFSLLVIFLFKRTEVLYNSNYDENKKWVIRNDLRLSERQQGTSGKDSGRSHISD